MRYQGIDDYSVMLTIASVIFSFLFCLSVARTFSETVSPFIGCRQRNYFFSQFPLWLFFTSPTLNPLCYSFFFFFLPSSLESPTTSVNPSALVLALSRLPSCSHSIKPQTENVNTATRPSFKQH